MRIKWRQGVIGIIALFMIIVAIIFQTPIEAQAEDFNINSLAQMFVDAVGGASGGNNTFDTIQGGISYKRTGYMCYLLTKDGNTIPGMTAKAFYSPGYSELAGATWQCYSKKGGYSVGSWTKEAPWQLAPFDGNQNTNVSQIKSWMTQMSSGEQNGIRFVFDNWGDEIAKKFSDGDYILVIETILHFQPQKIVSSQPMQSVTFAQIKGILLSRYGINIETMPSAQQIELVKKAQRLWNEKVAQEGDKYKKVGNPIIGTCYDCIEYEKAVGGDTKVFSAFTNRIAVFAEMIEGNGAGVKAGFKAWGGSTSTKISDNEVKEYGVGMMVIACGDSSIQTTYDESQGDTPSPAPIESVGQITIVKNYREKDRTTNTYEEKGCYIRNSLSGKIQIEDELSYKVIGWAVSTTTTPSPTISSLTWESSIPNTITSTGTTPTTVDITTPSTCLYHVNAKNSN